MSGGRPFELSEIPALSRSGVDRSEGLREEPERLRARWPSARVLLLDDAGRTPVPWEDESLREDAAARGGGGASDGDQRAGTVSPAYRPAAALGDEPPDGAVFLGQAGDVDYWALTDVEHAGGQNVAMPGRFGDVVQNVLADGEVWVGLREHGGFLDDAGAGLVTTALALRHWQRRARHCVRCGGRTELGKFGWVSRCTACGREDYPRTDPAVICLVHDDVGVNGEHVLLARQPQWPPHGYSVVAGFVEAGESLESTATREVAEETGVACWDLRYLGSQPWPFPRSIMLGFAARGDATAPLAPDDNELEDAGWFTREQVRAAFAREDGSAGTADAERDAGDPDAGAAGSQDGGEAGQLRLPGNSSIARVMLRGWAEAGA